MGVFLRLEMEALKSSMVMKKCEALPESDKVDRQVLLCEAAAERDAANIAFARIDGGKSKKEEAAKKEFRSVGKRLESISNIFDDKASVGEKALGDLIKDYAEQAKAIGASEYTKGGYEVMLYMSSEASLTSILSNPSFITPAKNCLTAYSG